MTAPGSILVTGANGGLGSAIVAHIAKDADLAKYTGLYSVRNADSATQLRAALAKAPDTHHHETLEVDLASIASVKRLATDINDRVSKGELAPIRALILNAGYQDHLALTMTEDGFETTWQVNYLANFILTLLLLQSIDKKNGTILFVASWAHDVDDGRNETGGFAPYKDPKWRDIFPNPELLASGNWSTPAEESGPYPGQRRYGASKLCAVMHMHELAERIARDQSLSGISVVGLDPGGMGTGLTRNSTLKMKLIMKAIPLFAAYAVGSDPNGTVRPTWKSAADVIRACFEIDLPKGKALYLNGTEQIETAKDSKDPLKRKQLWEYGVKVAHIGSNDTALNGLA